MAPCCAGVFEWSLTGAEGTDRETDENTVVWICGSRKRHSRRGGPWANDSGGLGKVVKPLPGLGLKLEASQKTCTIGERIRSRAFCVMTGSSHSEYRGMTISLCLSSILSTSNYPYLRTCLSLFGQRLRKPGKTTSVSRLPSGFDR
jgi:hypothetical protein